MRTPNLSKSAIKTTGAVVLASLYALLSSLLVTLQHPSAHSPSGYDAVQPLMEPMV